jgi:glycosyltransferase involved in cell wall biosynthesis
MSNSNSRIGIFLGYAPEQELTNQGIGRLLGFLIEGVIAQAPRSESIVIACPAWYVPQVRELLADLRIADDTVSLVTTDGIPYILRLRKLGRHIVRWRHGRQETGGKRSAGDGGVGFRIALAWLGTSNTASFLAQGVLLFFIGLLLLPVAVPAALILLLLAGLRALLGNVIARLEKRFPKARKFSGYVTSPLRELRRDEFAIRVFETIKKRELSRLVRKINRERVADVWYCPTIFWPEFADVAGPKAVAVPDMVFVDFPLGYASNLGEAVFAKAQEIIRAETHVVCYSDYVREAHLVDRLGVAPSRISVIRHGLVEMHQYVNGTTLEQRREWAIRTVNAYLRHRFRDHPYLAEFDFSDVRFALYASQARPHKNLLNLARTWEGLLRKDSAGTKLVLTCRLSDEPAVHEFVQARNLQHDILEFNGLPAEILAALNVLAAVAVNPSLFEGGFPFTFSEAYSVGTPSVMARIPVVLELVRDADLREAMLFDPYDSESMGERVRWALANRSRLLELQRPLYDEMARRGWRVAGSEYVALFSKLAAGA